MLFVLSGEIRTYLLSEEGREVTLFRLYPGELCVLSAPLLRNRGIFRVFFLGSAADGVHQN